MAPPGTSPSSVILWSFRNIHGCVGWILGITSFLSSVCSSWFSGSPTVGLSPALPPAFPCCFLSLSLLSWVHSMRYFCLQCRLQRLELALSSIGDSALDPLVFWRGGCWLNPWSSLGIWIPTVAVETTTGIWTTRLICITKVRGFISFKICPRKDKVTNSPKRH